MIDCLITICVPRVIKHHVWISWDPTLVQVCFGLSKRSISVRIGSWLKRAVRTSCSTFKLCNLLWPWVRLISASNTLWLNSNLSITMACMGSATTQEYPILLDMLAMVGLYNAVTTLGVCKSWALLTLLIEISLGSLTTTDVFLNLFSYSSPSHETLLVWVLLLPWTSFLDEVAPFEILTRG